MKELKDLLHTTVVTLVVLVVLFVLVEHAGPVVREFLFIQDCKSVDWITDTCTESHHFWRYN